MIKKLLVSLFILWGLFTNVYAATPTPDANGVFYVNKSVAVTSDQSGSSWANAMTEAADAFKFARTLNNITPGTVKQIWVAAGDYKPLYRGDNLAGPTTTDRNNTFILAKDVKVYGGFAGTETTLSERDLSITANESTLSGDLGTSGTATDNAYHVVISTSQAGTAELNGFTVSNGNANGGLGNINIDSFPFIKDYAGAIYIVNSTPLLANLRINNNYSNTYGAIDIWNLDIPNNPVYLYNISITGNNGFYRGSGILIQSAKVVLINTTISGCTGGDAALYMRWADVTLNNCVIWGNDAGVYVQYGVIPSVQNSLVQGYPADAINNNLAGTLDPKFVNAPSYTTAPFTGGDYSLQSDSPLINKGNNSYLLASQTTDISGKPRIVNTTVDIGAFEFGAPLEVTTTLTNVSCSGGNDGTATAVPTAGTTPYSYSWNTTPAQLTATAIGLVTGTYIVTVTDANGNSSDATATIVANDTEPPVADLAILPTITSAANLTNIITPPTATDNCDGAITGTTTTTFPITTSTTLIWTYTDNQGNTTTQNQQVVITPADITVSNDAGLCGAEVDYTLPNKLDVLVLGAAADTYIEDVRQKLLSTNEFNTVDGINIIFTTPDLLTLQQYDVILVFTDYPPGNPNLLGDNLALYIDGGGGVVDAMSDMAATYSILGAYNTDTYRVVNSQSYIKYAGVRTLGTILLPTHPIMNDVTSFNGGTLSLNSIATSLASNVYTIANYDNGTPFILAKENVGPLAVKRVSLNFFPPSSTVSFDFWDVTTDGTKLMANALKWVGNSDEITQTAGLASGAVFPVGTTTNTFEFTDANGVLQTFSFDVVVNDTEEPIVLTQDITVQLDANGTVTITSTDIDNGSTDNCTIDTMTLDTASFNCSNIGANTVTLTVTDVNGNSSNATATVTVEDVIAPAADVVNLTTITAQCEVTSIIPPTSTDNCLGTVIGTTTTTVPVTASTTVVWTYTDGTNTSTQNQTITIADTTAPVADLATLPILTAQCEVTSITPPTATDNCIGSVTATTTTTFPITASTTVVWTFTDGTNTSNQNQTVTIADTTAPVADLGVLPTVTEQCEVTSISPPTATDNCIGSVIATTTTTFPITASTTVVWTFTDGTNSNTQNQTIIINDTSAPLADATSLSSITEQCQVTSIIPPTATDNCIGAVTGTTTTTFPITASTTVVWTYTDGANTSTQNQSVIINDTTAPVADVVTLPTVTEQCQVTSIASPTATDNCIGTVTGTTTTTFPITASTTVVWTFTDVDGNSSTQSQSVIINDSTAPVADVVTLPIVTEQCQVTSIIPPTATDNCIGTVTGTTTTTFPITASTTVVWTFTDVDGNSSTQNQSVLIADTTAPVANIVTLPTINEQCQVTSIASPTATDNCIGTVTGTTTTTFPITASTTVVWTFTDVDGNSSTQNQSVVVADTTAPTADSATLPTINEQCQVATIIPPTATDNCIGIVTGTTSTSFPITVSTTVVWTYTDVDGNSSTQNQNIIIDDTIAPVANVSSLPIVTAICEVTSITPPTATDNCIGVVTGTTTATFPIRVSTTVVWTYVDIDGNSSTQNQSVVIEPVNLLITNPSPVCSGSTVDITAPLVTNGSTGNGTLTYWNDVAATNTLINPATIAVSGTYYIKSTNGNCSDIKPVVVLIKDLPTATITGDTICENTFGYVSFSGTPNTVVTYTIDGGVNNTITLNASGNANVATASLATDTFYQLVQVSYSSAPFCSQTVTESALVNVIIPVIDFTYSQENLFSDNTSIVITPSSDNGFINYQIDNESSQESNIFSNVIPGNHSLTLTDIYGCTYVTKDIKVMGYPKFFTPNGDGYNDTWNIIGIDETNEASLYIFDRYGKLVKEITNTNNNYGWDGTLNGTPLPSTDYWFTFTYKQDNAIRTFKSHFSLIR